MFTGSIVKRLSIIVVIIAAVILIYGLIDAGSYRDGYTAGYKTASRLTDTACMNGLVLDDGLCDKADVAVRAQGMDMSMGLAQVSALGIVDSGKTTKDAAAPAALSARRKKARQKTMQTPSPAASTGTVAPAATDQAVTNQSAGVQQQAAPVEQPSLPPPLPMEAQEIIAKASKLQELPPNFCLKNTIHNCGDEDRAFICSKASGSCAFNNISQELRSMDIARVDQYVACLTRDILYNRIGLAKQVLNTCVAVNGSSKAVFLNNTTEILTVGELARREDFKKKLTELGIPASTAVAPLPAASQVRPSCKSFMGTNTMPAGGCEPDSSMQPYSGGYMLPRQSSIYTPSILAQLLDIIIGLFTR